jgi:hypothetical protein
MYSVEEHGQGPWVCFCHCNSVWEKHKYPTEEQALAHRCRLGCRPRTHHLITRPEPRAVFTFKVRS